MSETPTRFPVGILCSSLPMSPVGSEKVVDAHARSLARIGYPVRVLAGSAFPRGDDFIVRSIPELSRSHPRIDAIRSSLAEGDVPKDYSDCVQDIAQAIGRELVGCGSIFVHDLLTSDANVPAADAIWRLAQGSRGVVAHGAPLRRWIAFAHDCAKPESKKKGAADRGPLKFVSSRMPGALYATPSLDRCAKLAKALQMPKADIRIVPGGVNTAEVLGLTDNVAELASEKRILSADVIMLTAGRTLGRKDFSRGLQIVRAIKLALGKGEVRWLITAPTDSEELSVRRTLDKLLVEREELGLREEVCFLSSECSWGTPRVKGADLWALFRLADIHLMPSMDEPFGLAAIEGALCRQLLVFGSAPALTELVTVKGEVVRLGKTETPAASAVKILKALAAMPSQAIRRRALKELDWDEIARRHLEPLINE